MTKNTTICSCLVTVCPCLADPEVREARRIDKNIEKEIKASMQRIRGTIKLLLLGTGEAGKSTMLKQMEIWYENGYTEKKLRSFIPHIHSNLMAAMVVFATQRRDFGIPLDPLENEYYEDMVLAAQPYSLEALSPELLEAIAILWRNRGIQKTFARRSEFQLGDSVSYLMGQLDRVRRSNYIPNQDDVLNVRIRTTGIVEYPFKVQKTYFRVVDIGGQRTERCDKLIYCFEDVNYIFFVASLADYCHVKNETDKRRLNRLRESLALLQTILETECLQNCGIMLFLNKTDLFEAAIKEHDLSDYFPEYKGPRKDPVVAQEFILELFRACNSNKDRPIFHHFTCAVNEKQFQKVFDIVRVHILKRHSRRVLRLSNSV